MKAVMMTAIAAAAATIVVAGCGSESSGTKAVDTSSPSYKQGLKSGTTGLAHIEAFKGMSGDRACQMSFDVDSGASPKLNKQDYIAGCLEGLSNKSTPTTPARRK